MAPLPSNSTNTYWLKYTSEGQQHELQFRLAAGALDSDATTTATDIANVLKSLMYTTDSFISLRRRASGINLSFPITFTPIAGTFAGTPAAGLNPAFFSLTGRSQGGRDCRMTFFTPRATGDESYRESSASYAFAANWIAAVTGRSPQVVAVDGQPVLWNPYVNIGYNSYFQRKQRRVG